jgi:hypothetical protein
MDLNLMKEIIENELFKRGINYFMSGSCRFGYSTENSDLDIIVDRAHSSKVEKLVKDFDGELVRVGRYASSATEFTIFGNKVHLQMGLDHSSFVELKAEHERVDALLKRCPYLVDFIRSLKQITQLVSGTHIYIILKQMAKNEVVVQTKSPTVDDLRDRFLRPV